jgi:hypothetical protein
MQRHVPGGKKRVEILGSRCSLITLHVPLLYGGN